MGPEQFEALHTGRWYEWNALMDRLMAVLYQLREQKGST